MTNRDHQDVQPSDRRVAAQSGPTVELGDVLARLMEERIAPEQARFESVAEQWAELLPLELHRHSKVAGISGGQLNVLADAPAYMYELQLRSAQLIEHLQQRCPHARIRTIKVALG
jgi:predicted nucleic acid-binding Zn ribbon protein